MRKIRLIQTAKDTGDRLAEKDACLLREKQDDKAGMKTGAALVLKPGCTYQKVIGFGGAFTESASYTFYRMNADKREEILNKYFDPEEGIGYSIGRVHINSCDFSLGNYTYVKDNDTSLDSFDISREEQWTAPFIKEAEAVRKGGIKLLASPWSPPGWMKTNGEMNHGGKLLPQYMETWARYYAKYIKAMKEKGVNIWAVTVQNEPAAVQTWDSCIYSAEEEGLFVRDYLGPTLEKEGLSDIKIYIWDHNRDIIVERAAGTLSVPGVGKYIYGIANHWYCSEAFENLSKVHELFPDKHILFTEGCQEGGVQLGSWSTGERYGRNMIGDFNNWQEGWLDWNLVLDEKGGPNHVGNYCDAPVIADTRTQELYYNISYFYIGHFSKFVKPGATRIGVEIKAGAGQETYPDIGREPLEIGSRQGQQQAQEAEAGTALRHVAFANEDGTVVLIVMNETGRPEWFNVELDGRIVSHEMPAHSIVTLIFER
ncbi:MAG: glycoside hydrolase family 30 protein [Bacillota bacterium]